MLLLSANAQEQVDVELEPVYSAPLPIIESSDIHPTGRIDFITEEILNAIQAGDLTSALRRVPGVTISRYNPVGAYGGSDGGGIFIRGHGTGRPGAEIATLIEGVPLFVGVWTHPLIDTLSIDLADSIEVFKSPQPIKIVNMGFGAVNLRAKKAILDGHHGELEASYGHYDTTLLRGAYELRTGDFGMVLSGSQRQSDGHRKNANGETEAFYGNFDYQLNEQWSVNLLTSLTRSKANDPEPEGIELPLVENYETNHQFYLSKLIYNGEQIDFELKLHLEDGEGNWLQWHQAPPPPFPSQSLRSITDYRNYGLKSSLRGGKESLQWTLGLDWDRFGGALTESYGISPANTFNDQYFKLTSPYLLLSHQIAVADGNQWILSAGARYLHHSIFEAETSGQIGIIYQTEGSRSYLQLSRSANYPGVFVSVFGRRPPPWQVGDDWRNLKAETINHMEMGVQWSISPELTIDLSLFRDDVENAIRLVAPPPSGYILNLGSYETQGMETMLRYQRQNWAVFSGLTWMENNSDLPNTPEWMGTIGFHFKKGPWTLAADYQHIASQLTYNPRFGTIAQQIDAYQLLSAKVSYTVESDNREWVWRYYLSGENLTNQPYEYRPGYPMPGISLTLGAKLSW